MVEIIAGAGISILLIWGFLLGGIFEDIPKRKNDRVSEDIEETLRNRRSNI